MTSNPFCTNDDIPEDIKANIDAVLSREDFFALSSDQKQAFSNGLNIMFSLVRSSLPKDKKVDALMLLIRTKSYLD